MAFVVSIGEVLSESDVSLAESTAFRISFIDTLALSPLTVLLSLATLVESVRLFATLLESIGVTLVESEGTTLVESVTVVFFVVSAGALVVFVLVSVFFRGALLVVLFQVSYT